MSLMQLNSEPCTFGLSGTPSTKEDEDDWGAPAKDDDDWGLDKADDKADDAEDDWGAP